MFRTEMTPWLAAMLVGATLPAPPPLQVLGAPPRGEIVGEPDSFVWIAPGQAVKAAMIGPGRVVVDVRRFRDLKSPDQKAQVDIELDGKVFWSRAVTGPLNRKVVFIAGMASSANLVEVPIGEGNHVVEVKVAKAGAPAMASFLPLEPAPEVALMPLPMPGEKPQAPAELPAPELPLPEPKPRPAKPAEPQVAEVEGETRVLTARQAEGGEPAGEVVRPPEAHAEEGARGAFALEVTAGAAVHLQLGGVSPAVEVSGEYQFGPGRSFGLGLEAGLYRYPLEVLADFGPPEGVVALSSSLTSVPLLARATWRPLSGAVQPFLGLGGGVALGFLGVEGQETASAVLPAGEARLGVGLSVGPGDVLIQGRLVAAGGAFQGVAQSIQIGGASAEAGYRIQL